jgi:hypothetical protein
LALVAANGQGPDAGVGLEFRLPGAAAD